MLAGLELPCFEAQGAPGGPQVCLLAGIHGGEYSSIAAVTRLMRDVDPAALSGRITAVPIVSMTSFRARTAFVVPEDGKNLNRCFPGSPDGTFSDILARHVFDELIAPSDVLIDLHGGDIVEALSRSRSTTSRRYPKRLMLSRCPLAFHTSFVCAATRRP